MRVLALRGRLWSHALRVKFSTELVVVACIVHDEDHLLAGVKRFEGWDEAFVEPLLESISIHVLVVVLDIAECLADSKRCMTK